LIGRASLIRPATSWARLRIQREAWSAFLKGPSYYRACLDLTRKARDLARRAIETAEIEIKANESIRDLVESTRQLAEEAALEVRSNGDPQAQRLLHGGIGQLERAQDAYRARGPQGDPPAATASDPSRGRCSAPAAPRRRDDARRDGDRQD
jgi:hypothetical protein